MTAPETRQFSTDFHVFLSLVGQLNYTWTNTESLLIHMIAGLAGVTKEVATIIFLTLNTSRARLDLVERLAKLQTRRPDLKDEVLALTGEMSKALKLKNKYNHCIYSFDNEGGNASTVLMRITDSKKGIEYGKTSPINTKELTLVRDTISRIEQVNMNLWDFFARRNFPI